MVKERGHCAACEGQVQALSDTEADRRLGELQGWRREKDRLIKDFAFRNYYETTAFVNAVAWRAHREDHHPELTFSYKNCRVVLSTHSVGGLSSNDFILASQIDDLLQ
jgi:4a-hydroxytetrahydrobiopterin dehydratase